MEEQIRQKREEAARNAARKKASQESRAKHDELKESVSRVSDTIKSHEPNVVVKNPVTSVNTPDIKEVVDSINQLNLTAYVNSQPLVAELTQRLVELCDQLDSVATRLKDSDHKTVVETLNSLTKQLKQVPKDIDKVNVKVDTTQSDELLQQIRDAVQKQDVSPTVKVDAPIIDLSGVEKTLAPLLKDVKKEISKIKFPEYKQDNSKVEKAVDKVLKAITSLRFPVPNYVLPFKDASGKAVQVQLDGSGNLPISANLSGADGAILDGVDSNVKATVIESTDDVGVFGLVALQSDGANISGGGAGSAAYSDSGGTDKKGLVDVDRHVQTDVLSSALPSGASTSAKQDTVIGHLDGVEGLLTTIDADTSNISTKIDTLVTNQQSDGLTDTELRATPVPVSGTVTANLSATDNAVLDQIELNTDPLLVVGSGTEATAQRVTIATDSTGVLSVDDNGGSLTVDGTVTANAGTNLNTSALALAATQTDKSQFTKLTDGTDTALITASGEQNVLETNSASIKTAVETIDNAVSGAGFNITQFAGTNNATGSGTATGALRVELPTNGTGVVGLNAGTNAIGKLAANSGVDIGDVTLTAGTAAIGTILPPDVDVTTHTNYAKKYYTSTGAVTDGIVWSPAAGKRWHVVSMHLNVSAAATVTLEDDKAGGDEVVWKAELAANSGETINFSEHYPLASGEDAADLIVTTTAGNIYITLTGYEV